MRVCYLFCGVFLSLLMGCSGGADRPYPLKGTVTIKGEGALTKGTIELSNGRFSAYAPIQEDGQFAVIGDGIPVGTYKAVFRDTSDGPTYEEPKRKVVRAIDVKYEKGETTPVTITIEPKTNVEELELDPATPES